MCGIHFGREWWGAVMHFKLTWADGKKRPKRFKKQAEPREVRKKPFLSTSGAWNLQNRGLEAPKSMPEASKIEAGAFQDAIF